MGSINDLTNDDAVPDDGGRPLPQEARAFLDDIEELQSDGGKYQWAVETLNGIYETVQRTKSVTEGQRRAVSNIRNSVEERERGRGKGSRRYEGWSR
jgi:hypothetical protein